MDEVSTVVCYQDSPFCPCFMFSFPFHYTVQLFRSHLDPLSNGTLESRSLAFWVETPFAVWVPEVILKLGSGGSRLGCFLVASERLGFRPSLVRELNILFLFSGGLFTGSTVMLEEGHCPVRGSIADVRLGDSRTFQDGAAAYAMLPSKK